MKIFYFRVALFLFFASHQYSNAQSKSQAIDDVIQWYNEARDSDTIGTCMTLNLLQTPANYYRSTYLYIHRELEDQLDQLVQTGPLPSGPDKGATEQIIMEHIAAAGRINAKIEELDLVSKALKKPLGITGRPLLSAYYLLSDWQLRNYYHELLRTYALNVGFANNDLPSFKYIHEEVLFSLERELQIRQMFPQSSDKIPDYNNLLERRFRLVEELNTAARKEAFYLADGNSLLVHERVYLAELGEQVHEIDKNLKISPEKSASVRDLLTEETILTRLEILEHGKRITESKYNITRHFEDAILLQLLKIDEQLAEERKWLYREKNHQVIERGYTSRGPPGDMPPGDFETQPFPKSPPGRDRKTLGEFLSEAQATQIEKDKQKSFEKFVNKFGEKTNASYSNSIKWQDYSSTTKFTRNATFNTSESYLRYLATQHLETLPFDPVKAGQHRAEFETAAKHLAGDEKLSMVSFLGDDPTKLAIIERNLNDRGTRLEKQIRDKGHFAEPWLFNELEEIKSTAKRVFEARQKLSLRPRIEKGHWVNRPPPSEYSPLYSIQNEAYYKETLQAQRKDLEMISARYGRDVSPSVGIRIEQINRVLTSNEMAQTLHNYQNNTEEAYWINIMESIDPDNPELKILRARQQTLSSDVENAFREIRANKNKVSPILFEQTRSAYNTLTPGSKKASRLAMDIGRPNQNIDKVISLSIKESPGGIWLSPEGIEIKPVSTYYLPWSYAKWDKTCPNTDDHQWLMDIAIDDHEWTPDTYNSEWLTDSEDIEEDYEIICFPNTTHYINTEHWLNQIKPW